MSGVETVFDGATLVGLIHRGPAPDHTAFLTGPDAGLQVGHVVHPSGHVIAPHEHVERQRTITSSVEVLLVLDGRCEVQLYSTARSLLSTPVLSAGDLIVLLSGAHGFRMLEDTVLLEVKQGPFGGPGDKRFL